MPNFSNTFDITVHFSLNPKYEISYEDAVEIVNTIWSELQNKPFISKTDIIALNILTKCENIIHDYQF